MLSDWYQLTLPLLYRRLASWGLAQRNSLVRTLSDSPHLVAHVRTLSISLGSGGYHDSVPPSFWELSWTRLEQLSLRKGFCSGPHELRRMTGPSRLATVAARPTLACTLTDADAAGAGRQG